MALHEAAEAQVSSKDITALADAKAKLAKRTAQLRALHIRAMKAGNTKTRLALEADLKDAASLSAKLAGVDAMLAPFLKAWAWAKGAIGLGELGAVFVPFAVTAAIAAVIYAINVFDRKIESASDRYKAELDAVDEWKSRGLSEDAARDQVNKTGEQIHGENKSKPGLFGNVGGLVKFGAALGVIGGGLWWMSNRAQARNQRG